MKKVAVIGPESAGKSTLCLDLAQFYEIEFVPEFAREYLTEMTGGYSEEDLLYMAEEQLNQMNSALSSEKEMVLSDTDVLTIKIWSLIKYGRVDKRIETLLDHQKFNLYLLCNADIPWQEDPLREVPSYKKRQEIFNLFESEIQKHQWHYGIISGDRKARLKAAIGMINSF